MKHFDFKFLRVWMVLWCAGVLLPAAGQGSAGSADVLRLIEKVNDYWQANNCPRHALFGTTPLITPETWKLTG